MKTNLPPSDQTSGSVEDRIVREVIRRLKSLEAAPPDGTGDILPAAPAAEKHAPADAPAGPAATIRAPVVALAALAELPDGVRRLQIARRAVVTPSAADWIRDRRIQVERFDEQLSRSTPLVLVSDTPGPACERARSWIQKAAGLVDYHTDPCPEALGRYVAQQVTDGATCVWLTERPVVALCRSNRLSGVRAAWAIDPSTVRAAVDQLHANVWITEPARHSAAQWNHLLRIACIA